MYASKRPTGVLLIALSILYLLAMMTACGGTSSAGFTPRSTTDPAPSTTFTVSPSAAIATGQSQDFTITGSNFTSSSTVFVNGHIVVPNSATSTTLQITVPGELMQNPGTLSLSPYTPGEPANSVLPKNIVLMSPGTVATTSNPQVAAYTMTLPSGYTMSVRYGQNGNLNHSTWTQPAPGGGGSVKILVGGLLAGAAYDMRAQVTTRNGVVLSDSDHTFSVPARAANLFPPFSVTTTGDPSGGLEMVNSFPVSEVITDLQGNVRWQFQNGQSQYGQPFPMRRMQNGDFAVLLSDYSSLSAVCEIDLSGSIVKEVSLATINSELKEQGADFQIQDLDHDLLPLPNGHIIVIASISKDLTDLTGYPGTTRVLGNALVDLDANFVPVWTWNTFDHLDVNRHPMNFPDWTHANALLYTSDGNLLLSLRHQNWIIKIDYENGKGNGDVLWKLGYQGDFQLAGNNPGDWYYAQHMPTIVSQDGSQMTLAVFDDGNNRVMDDAGDVCGTGTQPACYSRAAIFTIDQSTMSAQLDWEYKPGYFSFWGGNTEVLGNGDVEFDMSQPFPGVTSGEVMEVTQTSSPQVVWQMVLPQYTMYRAYRIPGLYPGVAW